MSFPERIDVNAEGLLLFEGKMKGCHAGVKKRQFCSEIQPLALSM
jgi:hypothetical protein